MKKLITCLIISLTLGSTLAQGPGRGFPGNTPQQPGNIAGPGFAGRGGNMGYPDLDLVDDYDQDGDGVLDAAERSAALADLDRQVRSSAAGNPGPELTAADVTLHTDGEQLYDPTVIRTIFLEIEEENWEAELEAFYNTDVHLLATAAVDGSTYEDVGVRFRGNSTYTMVPAGLRRPLRLKFDLVQSGQNLEGYRTLNLSNGLGDASSIRTVLYSLIGQDYIAMPQAGLTRLVVNGESWGIYQNQQHYNKDFLNDFFSDADGVRWKVPGSPNGQGGMLYLGDDIEAYRSIYEIDNKDTDASWEALINLFKVLNETPDEDLVEALEPVLDIDGVLRFMALEVALVNSDGFYSRASDYYIYLDSDGVFHVMPHDFNEALSSASGFGGRGGSSGATGVTLDPLTGLNDSSKPLRSRLLAIPELQERYLAYVRDIAERWLDWEVLGPIATELHEAIDADFASDTRALVSYQEFQASLDSLQGFVTQRREYLLSVIPESDVTIELR